MSRADPSCFLRIDGNHNSFWLVQDAVNELIHRTANKWASPTLPGLCTGPCRLYQGADLAIAIDNELARGQVFKPHGTVGMQLGGGNADFNF